jgi:tetratricopeptide (TPR) repeat protein
MRTYAPPMITRFSGMVLLFFVFTGFVYSAPSALRGYIKEKTTEKPLIEVRISLVSLKGTSARYELQADKIGIFFKTGLRPGMYRLTAEKDGYIPIQTTLRLKAGELYEADFGLELLETEISETAAQLLSMSNKLMRAGKYDGAIEKITQAIEAAPEHFILYYYRARVYERKSDYDQALADYIKAQQLKPDFLLPLVVVGDLYAKKEEFSKATFYFKKADELGLTDTFALYNYGACLIYQRRTLEARRVFEKVVQLDTGYADAYYQLAIIHLGLNDYTKAKECLETFIRLDPGNRNVSVAQEILQTLE